MNKKEKTKIELLEIKNLNIKYNDRIILTDVNFIVNKGDFIGIVGANGSGKTTLIKYILGILKNANISKESKLIKYDALKKYGAISYVSQNTIGNFKNFPARVEEIILMGLLTPKTIFYTLKDKKRVDDVIEKLNIQKLRNSKISELSGGEKQKVYLARAIISNPELLILDEPLSAIDEKAQEEIYRIVDILNKEGTTIIMISHDIDEIVKHANKIIMLDNELRYFGETKDYVACDDCREVF